jgi:hypothetical protein
MSNRVFLVFIALLLSLGIYLGWVLAARPVFSIPAVLNVVGIAYSAVAVVVLYESVAENATFKQIVVSHIAPALLHDNPIRRHAFLVVNSQIAPWKSDSGVRIFIFRLLYPAIVLSRRYGDVSQIRKTQITRRQASALRPFSFT